MTDSERLAGFEFLPSLSFAFGSRMVLGTEGKSCTHALHLSMVRGCFSALLRLVLIRSFLSSPLAPASGCSRLRASWFFSLQVHIVSRLRLFGPLGRAFSVARLRWRSVFSPSSLGVWCRPEVLPP